MLVVGRIRLRYIANSRQVTKLEPLGIAHSRITDDPVPRPAGPIGIVPATHQVELPISGEIDKARRVWQSEWTGLTGVVAQQIAHTDHRCMNLRLKRGTLGDRPKLHFELRVRRIGDHPLQSSPIAVGKILGARKRHRLSGCQIDHFKRIGVEHALAAVFTNDLSAIDDRVERHIAFGKR